jgi:hypothetical protein
MTILPTAEAQRRNLTGHLLCSPAPPRDLPGSRAWFSFNQANAHPVTR